MDKATFDSVIQKKAQAIYEQKYKSLEAAISDYFKKNPEMNNHSWGNSMNFIINDSLKKIYKDREKEIVEAIAKNEINEVLNKINEMSFLFNRGES